MSTQNVGHLVPVPVSDVCVGTLSPLSLGLESLGCRICRMNIYPSHAAGASVSIAETRDASLEPSASPCFEIRLIRRPGARSTRCGSAACAASRSARRAAKTFPAASRNEDTGRSREAAESDRVEDGGGGGDGGPGGARAGARL